MNLSCLTARGLRALWMDISTLEGAMTWLEARFPGAYVDLTPDQLVRIHLPVILRLDDSDLGDPGPVDLVEDETPAEALLALEKAAAEFAANTSSALDIATAIGEALGHCGQEAANPGGDPAAGPQPLAEPDPVPASVAAVPAPEAAAAPVEARGKVMTGPLSDAEREVIVRMRQAGRSNGEIAAAINRRVQTVALFRAAVKAEAPEAGFRDIGAVVDQVVARLPADAVGAEQAQEPAAEIAPAIAPAPVAAPADRGAATVPEDMHGEPRRIWEYLDGVGYKGRWDAELDHEMVEMLLGGAKPAQVALDLDVDAGAIKARWLILSNCILDAKARPTIDGKKHLLAVLKARVIRKRQGSAGRA